MNQIHEAPKEKTSEELRKEQLLLLKESSSVTDRQALLIVQAQYDSRAFQKLFYEDDLFTITEKSHNNKKIVYQASLHSYLLNKMRQVRAKESKVRLLSNTEYLSYSQDIMQEVMIDVKNALPRFQGLNNAQFTTYVYKILHAKVVYYLKKTIIPSRKEKSGNNIADEGKGENIPISNTPAPSSNLDFNAENIYVDVDSIEKYIEETINHTCKKGSKSYFAVQLYYRRLFSNLVDGKKPPSQQDICNEIGISNSTLSSKIKACQKWACQNHFDIRGLIKEEDFHYTDTHIYN